jgi:hypothetical protein
MEMIEGFVEHLTCSVAPFFSPSFKHSLGQLSLLRTRQLRGTGRDRHKLSFSADLQAGVVGALVARMSWIQSQLVAREAVQFPVPAL